MSNTPVDVQQKVNGRKLIIPVSIGIAVSLYLLLTNFDPSALRSVHITAKLILGLSLAAATVIIRDFAFTYKIRLSTGEKLTWPKTIQTILMWEFGAAITPKFGEVAFILFVLKKSGLSYGRSVAAVLLNSFLDNLVFVIVFPLLYWHIGPNMFAISADCPDLVNHKVMLAVRGLASNAWYGYAGFVAITVFFGVSLFVLPHTTRKFFHALARVKFLSRFSSSIKHLGDEIEITAKEYSTCGPSFYFKMGFATLFNWTSRYLLVVAILYAFNPGGFNLTEALARQYVLWIFMVLPSTPGAAGLAEIAFISLNCEYMPLGLSAAIALVWRMYSYYIYLLLGMLILPRWAAGPRKRNLSQS